MRQGSTAHQSKSSHSTSTSIPVSLTTFMMGLHTSLILILNTLMSLDVQSTCHKMIFAALQVGPGSRCDRYLRSIQGIILDSFKREYNNNESYLILKFSSATATNARPIRETTVIVYTLVATLGVDRALLSQGSTSASCAGLLRVRIGEVGSLHMTHQ